MTNTTGVSQAPRTAAGRKLLELLNGYDIWWWGQDYEGKDTAGTQAIKEAILAIESEAIAGAWRGSDAEASAPVASAEALDVERLAVALEIESDHMPRWWGVRPGPDDGPRVRRAFMAQAERVAGEYAALASPSDGARERKNDDS